ncbi:MAG: antibiotic biosynthesis monooxygenase [Ignavibacteria bacterium]
MIEDIFWITAAKVKEGQFVNLKTLMNEMVASAKANEPGTLNYEWFISDDGKYCHLYEHFKDSESAQNHMNSFVKNFAKRFMEALEIKNFNVYGSPSEELAKILVPSGAVLMKPLGGFKK